MSRTVLRGGGLFILGAGSLEACQQDILQVVRLMAGKHYVSQYGQGPGDPPMNLAGTDNPQMRGMFTIENAVPGIDELRVMRDRARARLQIAAAMEDEALNRLSGDSTGFAAWRQAMDSTIEAQRSLEAAEREYRTRSRLTDPSS